MAPKHQEIEQEMTVAETRCLPSLVQVSFGATVVRAVEGVCGNWRPELLLLPGTDRQHGTLRRRVQLSYAASVLIRCTLQACFFFDFPDVFLRFVIYYLTVIYWHYQEKSANVEVPFTA